MSVFPTRKQAWDVHREDRRPGRLGGFFGSMLGTPNLVNTNPGLLTD